MEPLKQPDQLGDRMKGYEHAARVYLPRRMPVILRVDGKAFHTYTRGCKKPFDDHLMGMMDETAMALCEEIQGAQLAYVQSDEISILAHNYKRLNTSAWFDNAIQKMCSVAAGVASATFTHLAACPTSAPAVFDARAFVLPEAEVCNYFVWRQQDARRNAVQMVARSMFSHRECNLRTCNDLRAMIATQGPEFETLAARYRLGRCVTRQTFEIEGDGGPCIRSRWVVDNEIPVFESARDYIDRHLAVEVEA